MTAINGRRDPVALHLWSTGGHERFRLQIAQHLPSMQGAIIVLDMTSSTSFLESRYWYQEMVRLNPTAAVVFIGNKCELVEKLVVSSEEAAAFAQV